MDAFTEDIMKQMKEADLETYYGGMDMKLEEVIEAFKEDGKEAEVIGDTLYVNGKPFAVVRIVEEISEKEA